MEISATPGVMPSGLALAAITPSRRKRLLIAGAAATAATGSAPSRRERSARTGADSLTTTAFIGTGSGRTRKRMPQNTVAKATRAQITKADNRAIIGRL